MIPPGRKMPAHLVLLILASIGCQSNRSSTRPIAAPAPNASKLLAPIPWLKANVISIRTTNPGDTDFTDLEPLRDKLKGVDVVMLGEQTHGDGTTFKTKTRLIKFLHEKLGFDVLAFESDMFSCLEADRQMRRTDVTPVQAASQCIWPLWAESKEMAPLWSYLREAAGKPHRLELWGFDPQPLAPYSKKKLASYLNHAFSRCTDERPLIEAVLDALKPIVDHRKLGLEAGKLTSLKRLIEIAGTPCVARSVGVTEAAFVRQLLVSLAAYAPYRTPGNKLTTKRSNPKRIDVAGKMNPRDAQMADNLLWLLKHRWRGRRVIVWGASIHLARKPSAIDTTPLPFDYRSLRSTGELVANALGKRVYSIGFLALEGKWGGHLNQPHYTIGPASAGSFERLIADAGFENAFVELRGAEANDWRSQIRVARPLGYLPMRARWPIVFDAFVYTRMMTPNTQPRAMPSKNAGTK